MVIRCFLWVMSVVSIQPGARFCACVAAIHSLGSLTPWKIKGWQRGAMEHIAVTLLVCFAPRRLGWVDQPSEGLGGQWTFPHSLSARIAEFHHFSQVFFIEYIIQVAWDHQICRWRYPIVSHLQGQTPHIFSGCMSGCICRKKVARIRFDQWPAKTGHKIV